MIFQIKGGHFGYEQQREVLRNINVQVPQGRILAILGPNGVGKTTLLKCMMGLLPWKSGASYLDDKDIKKIPPRKLWQRIAYVPQAKGKTVSYTGAEMVVLGRSMHLGMLSQPKKSDWEKAYQAMESLGIAHLGKRLCTEMSGGEFQMVLIARALTAEPDMLVLDEPESNLDFKNQLIILETMRNLTKKQGITCIFNTHYPDHALKIADDALLMDKNGDSRSGKSEDIISIENMRHSFEVNVHISHITVDQQDIASVIPLSIL